MKKTKNPVVWAQYGAWHVSRWMWRHQPRYPLRFSILILTHWPHAARRAAISRRQWEYWQKHLRDFDTTDVRYKPLPWFLGEHCAGPFVKPWRWLERRAAKCTGGRSHRCEFTDKEMGALYGHKHGAFMNAYFDQFISNIGDKV